MHLLNPRTIFSEYLTRLKKQRVIPHEQFMVMVAKDVNTGNWLGDYCVITDNIESIIRLYDPLLETFDNPQTVHFTRYVFEGEHPLLHFVHDERTHLSAILIQDNRAEKVRYFLESFATEL